MVVKVVYGRKNFRPAIVGVLPNVWPSAFTGYKKRKKNGEDSNTRIEGLNAECKNNV